MSVKDGLEVAEKALNVAKEGSGFIDKLLSANPTYRANKLLLDEIEHDPNMNPMEKYVIMRNLNKIKKEIMNNTNIYNIANSMLGGKGQSLEKLLPTVDDEWLGMYDNISKNVTDKDMQTVWAKILASKCEDGNSVSKKLLQVLQVMNSKDAEIFSYLCSHSVMILNSDDDTKYPLFFYPNKDLLDYYNIIFYNENYVNYNNISNLSNLGLINFNVYNRSKIYNGSNRVFFSYYRKKICIFLKYEGIEIGHITYTRCGAELVNLLYDGMLENSDPLLLDKIVDYYKSQDYIIEQGSG